MIRDVLEGPTTKFYYVPAGNPSKEDMEQILELMDDRGLSRFTEMDMSETDLGIITCTDYSYEEEDSAA